MREEMAKRGNELESIKCHTTTEIGKIWELSKGHTLVSGMERQLCQLQNFDVLINS